MSRLRLPSLPPRIRTTLLVLAVAWVAGQFTDRGQLQVPALLQTQEWEYLSDRPWEFADTAWLMMGNEATPAVDGTFLTGSPLTIGDHVYGKGFGVFTPSEISFDLQGAFARLEGVVGVEPDERPEPSSDRRIRFVLYADGERVLETELLGVRSEPYPIAVSLRGVNHLRLATEREPGARTGVRAMWADMRVQRELPNPTVAVREAIGLAAQSRNARTQRFADSQSVWDVATAQAQQELDEALAGDWPEAGAPPAVVAVDQRLALVSATTAVTVGLAGDERGRISALQRAPMRLVVRGLTLTAVDTSGEAVLSLVTAAPDFARVRTRRITDTALGLGTQLSVPFMAGGAALSPSVSRCSTAPPPSCWTPRWTSRQQCRARASATKPTTREGWSPGPTLAISPTWFACGLSRCTTTQRSAGTTSAGPTRCCCTRRRSARACGWRRSTRPACRLGSRCNGAPTP